MIWIFNLTSKKGDTFKRLVDYSIDEEQDFMLKTF